MRMHRTIPFGVMGLCNLLYGLFAGSMIFGIPQLLGDRHVPEATIASLTAVALSPGFWAFFLSPLLDVRFSRRTYAIVLGFLSAGMLVLSFLSLHNLPLLELALTLGFLCAYLYQSALGGWFSSIATADEERMLSVFMTVGNVGGAGIMAVACNQIVRRLTPLHAALVLATIILVPMLPIPFAPAPAPDRRLARESFGRFFGEVASLLRKPSILLALLLFAAPCATFALTNFLPARGADFHASPAFVGLIGGIGVAAGGIVGCFLFPLLSSRLPPRLLYLAIGIVGSLSTLGFTLLPHAPAVYAALTIVENLLQALALTTLTAIAFQIIGRQNPLAATTFCIIGSACGLPLTYMLYVDAWSYNRGGINGSLAVDAVIGITASLLFALLFWRLRGHSARLA